MTPCSCDCTVNPLILSPARSGALVCRAARHATGRPLLRVGPWRSRAWGLPPLCAISAADWPVRSVFRTSSLPQGGPQVLGANLNRSESRGSTGLLHLTTIRPPPPRGPRSAAAFSGYLTGFTSRRSCTTGSAGTPCRCPRSFVSTDRRRVDREAPRQRTGWRKSGWPEPGQYLDLYH